MNIFKKTLVALSTITLLAGITACGEMKATGTLVHSERTPSLAPVVYNESDIADHIGLDHRNMVSNQGVWCEAAVILTSADMVELYDGPGTATNPDRTAGVSIAAAELATCVEFITYKLSDFPEED